MFLRIITFLAVLITASVSLAQLGPDFGSPGKHKGRISLKLAGDAFHESDDSYVSEQTEAYFYLPVYQNENTTYAVTAKSYTLNFANLQDYADFKAVKNLHVQTYGFVYAYEEADKNTWGVSGNYGSASDEPFASADVSAFDLTLTRKTLNHQRHRGFIF